MVTRLRAICFVCFLSGFGLVGQHQTLNGQSKPSSEFRMFFEEFETVALDEGVIIGTVSFLDADAFGRLLVTDQVGKAVYLFDKRGKRLKTLSPDKCHPGFHWAPFKAVFCADGTILVLNSFPWGFRFDSEGSCLGGLDAKFTPPTHVGSVSSGELYGFYITQDSSYIKKMDRTGKSIKIFAVQTDKVQTLQYRVPGGGLVCDASGYVYLSKLTSPEILKYDSEGRLTMKMENNPSYYRRVESDISRAAGGQSLMKEIPRVLEGKTTTLTLHLLDENLLLLQFALPNKMYGIEVFDTDGRDVLHKQVVTSEAMYSARKGLVYVARQPEPDNNGNLPNPVIVSFKFTKSK
jgi:hypothetical protein